MIEIHKWWKAFPPTIDEQQEVFEAAKRWHDDMPSDASFADCRCEQVYSGWILAYYGPIVWDEIKGLES